MYRAKSSNATPVCGKRADTEDTRYHVAAAILASAAGEAIFSASAPGR